MISAVIGSGEPRVRCQHGESRADCQSSQGRSIGLPLPDTGARIVDLETGLDVPQGGTGELLIRGPQVEETLYAHPAVELAAVVGVPDTYRGEVVEAYVVLRGDQRDRITTEEMIRFCRARLTTYKAPRIVEFRAELPITTTGKLLRRALREA